MANPWLQPLTSRIRGPSIWVIRTKNGFRLIQPNVSLPDALVSCGMLVSACDISEQQTASANARNLELGSGPHLLSYDGCSIPFPDTFFGSVSLWSQVLGHVPGSKQRLALFISKFTTRSRETPSRRASLSYDLTIHNGKSTLTRLISWPGLLAAAISRYLVMSLPVSKRLSNSSAFIDLRLFFARSAHLRCATFRSRSVRLRGRTALKPP